MMKKKQKIFKNFMHSNHGATAIEYALIAALISVVIIGGLSLTSTNVQTMYSGIAAAVSNTIAP